VGLSPLAPQDYNTELSTTQRPLICRSSGYWTIERCLMGTGYSMLRGSYAFVDHPREQYLRTSSATTPHESPLK